MKKTIRTTTFLALFSLTACVGCSPEQIDDPLETIEVEHSVSFTVDEHEVTLSTESKTEVDAVLLEYDGPASSFSVVIDEDNYEQQMSELGHELPDDVRSGLISQADDHLTQWETSGDEETAGWALGIAGIFHEMDVQFRHGYYCGSCTGNNLHCPGTGPVVSCWSWSADSNGKWGWHNHCC